MRNGWFIWLNFLCLIVVVQHHIAHVADPGWLRRAILLAVPIFSIISGYCWGVILKKTSGENLLGGMRFFVYPYLFWLVVYHFYCAVLIGNGILHHGYDIPSVRQVVRLVLTGQTFGPLYYAVSLVYLMVLTIWFYRLLSGKIVFYVLSGICSVAALLADSFVGLMPKLTFGHFFYHRFCWVATYFLIGIIFSVFDRKVFCISWIKKMLPFLWCCGVVVLFSFARQFRSVIITCTVLMTALCFPDIRVADWVKATSSYVFGIYLVHGILTETVNIVMVESGIHKLGLPYNWLLAVVLVFGAWGLVWLMRRIPVLKSVV